MNITSEISFHASVTCCNRDLHFSHPLPVAHFQVHCRSDASLFFSIAHSVSVLSNLLCEWKIDNSPWDVTLYAQCTTVIKWKSYTYSQHFQYLWKIDIFFFIFQLFLIFLTQFGHLSFSKMCFLWEYHETNILHISELMPMLWHMAA